MLAAALASARRAALDSGPGVQVLAIGVPLYAEAQAVQASREMQLIGWGSLAAVLLLVWLSFRSLRPLALVALSLVIGTAAALSVTALVFGQVHLLTLVFGASLVGVAEDYGIHYFASRQHNPAAAPRPADASPVARAGHGAGHQRLGLPVPGAGAVSGPAADGAVSVAGLAAAFLTVVCWFPFLDRGRVPVPRFAQAIAGSLARWPRWSSPAAGVPLAGRGAGAGRARWRLVWLAGAGLFCLGGWAQLQSADDIRQLQTPPQALLAVQQQVARLLPMPASSQFFRVQAVDSEMLLQREEALRERLQPLIDQGELAGVAALSDWVPSQARQRADAALSAAAEGAVLRAAGRLLGENLPRPEFARAPLSLPDWLAQPASGAAAALWLGEVEGQATSIVMLHGLHDAALGPRLAGLVEGLQGVRWIDRPAEVSAVLQRYRIGMGELLVVGHLVTLLALCWRFGRCGWRAWLPTALASAFTVAALGWLGQPMQLFNILALLLLLGIGVDYGIFLVEHRGDGSAWLAVVLGAASTWLAFGLLGLSATPALRAFGSTLLIGIVLVWLICPLLRPAGAARPTGRERAA